MGINYSVNIAKNSQKRTALHGISERGNFIEKKTKGSALVWSCVVTRYGCKHEEGSFSAETVFDKEQRTSVAPETEEGRKNENTPYHFYIHSNKEQPKQTSYRADASSGRRRVDGGGMITLLV